MAIVTAAVAQQAQSRAQGLMSELRITAKPLDALELEHFALSFERLFLLQFRERPAIADFYFRHIDEIILGAMQMKEQTTKNYGGSRPPPGTFGMIPIRAGFFGYDDWDELGSITGGATANWIHSGTTILGGTAGNAVRIGANASHVIIGISDDHPTPSLEMVRFVVDGDTKPIILTGFATLSGRADLALTELDKAFLWKKGNTVLGIIFQRPTKVTIPRLWGASFITEDQLRTPDPADLDGTTPDVIITT